MKVGDFVTIYFYGEEEPAPSSLTVLDLTERKGIITTLDEAQSSIIQVLWEDGSLEWIASSLVMVATNPNIS